MEYLLGPLLSHLAAASTRLAIVSAASLWGDDGPRTATSIPGRRYGLHGTWSCADQVTAADGAEIYNPAPVSFGSHAILSQDAYVCGATHDYDDPAFPLLAYAMSFGAYSWVCARASVAPGVSMGDGAVLGLGSVATRNLEAWTIYAGVPAVKLKERQRPADRGSNIL